MNQPKRFMTLVAFVATLLLLLPAVAFADLESIQEEGEVTLVMSGGYPPFSMIDEDGDLIGFDADVAVALAERLGVEPVLQQAEFATIIAGIQAGAFDISVASHARTEERARAVTFTDDPYYYSGAQLFVPTDSEFSSYEELREAGAAIAVDLGGTNQQWLEDDGYPNITTYSGVQESLLAVQSGRAAAIFTSPIVGNLAIREQELDLQPIDELLFQENAYITIANNQPELKAAIEEALDAMREDGTLAAISEEWVGADITSPPSSNE
jgi:ABC-type amino acid transport substrate-binding protein